MIEREEASQRVFKALSRGEEPSEDDIINCGVHALMAAQKAEREKNPLLAAHLDRMNGYR